MISLAGHLRLRTAAREHGRTALVEQAFRAPFHVSKPYWDADTRTLLVQVVNPTAGILAGDRLTADIAVSAGTSLLVTTPSASRVFMMKDGAAECRQRFTVETQGWLEVMPEPLVPHRGSCYSQRTEIEADPGAELFFVDQLLPGRIGFGETWSWAQLNLTVTVRIGGRLILRERFCPSGPELRDLAAWAGSGPTACFANAVLLTRSADAEPPWKARLIALHQAGIWVGATALREGGWTIKVIAPDPLALRDTLGAIREILATAFPQLRCSARKL